MIPVNVANFFFGITSKVADRIKSLDGKESKCYDNFFQISKIWKSNHWSLHKALISKRGQNTEMSGICLFSNYFRDLLTDNVHIYEWPKPSTWYLILRPVNYGMHLYNIFMILIIMFDFVVIWKCQRPSKW